MWDHGLFKCDTWVPECVGSRAHRLSSSAPCGILDPDQGSNLQPCTARLILNHWTTKELLRDCFWKVEQLSIGKSLHLSKILWVCALILLLVLAGMSLALLDHWYSDRAPWKCYRTFSCPALYSKLAPPRRLYWRATLPPKSIHAYQALFLYEGE